MNLEVVVIVIHVTAGILALLIGLVPLLSPKGQRLHRRSGRMFVVNAAIVLGAAGIGDFFFTPPAALVAATVAAGYGYLSSLRALSLKLHGPGRVDGALAVLGLGACVALYLYMGPGTASWTPAIGYSTIGYVGAMAVYDLSRFFWSAHWLAHARPLDHGLKMTGVYFGFMSAGFGNLFPALQPWSQVGPTMLGFTTMFMLVVIFLLSRRHRAHEPAADVLPSRVNG